jgi:hypothetical protein
MAGFRGGFPAWVPQPVQHYLAHTEAGAPIRALAREAGCHASTVLRHIQRFETRRDDLLIDEALHHLGRQVVRPKKDAGSLVKETRMKNKPMVLDVVLEGDHALTDKRLCAESQRVLRRLCEKGAVLAVAAEMDKAVVVREDDQGNSTRTAIVEREIAAAMALKNWISCDKPARIARYKITGAGRTALNHFMAEAENKASGFADAQAPFSGQVVEMDAGDEGRGRSRRNRYGFADTPLSALARRKDRDGQLFLSNDLVRAGERLREDFELSMMGPRATQNWDQFLTGEECASTEVSQSGPGVARARVEGALRDLGPGLGDVVLRCCCYLEGLERAEKRMGWSARSGKIVLRIALQRLKRHYESLGDAGGMIA